MKYGFGNGDPLNDPRNDLRTSRLEGCLEVAGKNGLLNDPRRDVADHRKAVLSSTLCVLDRLQGLLAGDDVNGFYKSTLNRLKHQIDSAHVALVQGVEGGTPTLP